MAVAANAIGVSVGKEAAGFTEDLIAYTLQFLINIRQASFQWFKAAMAPAKQSFAMLVVGAFKAVHANSARTNIVALAACIKDRNTRVELIELGLASHIAEMLRIE